MNPNSIVSRIFEKDTGLWKGDPALIFHRLGWLDCVDEFEPKALVLDHFSKSVPYSHVVLLGMGGSSLVSRVLQNCLSHPTRIFHVLDSTDPQTILDVQRQIPLKDTLFIVASKSGSTIEVDSLCEYFFSICPSPEQFISITDFNTPLMRLSETRKFRHIFVNPSDIGGRFSALSYFGLVPLALMGGNVHNFLACAKETLHSSKDDSAPAAKLADFLFQNLQEGRNKLTFLASKSISSLPPWIEQLIAESSGKDGQGFLPVIETVETFHEWEASDRCFIVYETSSEHFADRRIQNNSKTMIRQVLKSDDLAKEFFDWELATAILGSKMNINPFDEPNVVQSKKNTRVYLQNSKQVYEKINLAVSRLNEISKHLTGTQTPEFIAILSYLPESSDSQMIDLQRSLAAEHHVAVTWNRGPCYLHSTGQFHKGGPNQGRFIIFVDDQSDLPIPGRPYGFQTLKQAQALGDFEALKAASRKVMLIKL